MSGIGTSRGAAPLEGQETAVPRPPMTRRRFLENALLTTILIVGGRVLAGCAPPAGPTLQRAREQGFIRVGLADEPPYGYVADSGRVTGAVPEVAREVMQRLGVPQLDGVLTSFGALLTGLEEERFDVVVAGMFITPERCSRVIFSDPLFCVEQAFLVAEGNPFGIDRYEDIGENDSVRLGVMTGAIEVTQAEESGVPLARVSRYDTASDLLAALQGGRIDAAALTTISLERLARRADMSGVEVTPGFAYRGRLGCGAFAFRPRDEELRDEFNRVLGVMREEGSLASMVADFGFGPATEAAANLTARELCSGP